MPRISQFAAIWISMLIIVVYFILYYYTEIYTSKFIADWLALIGISFMSVSTLPVAWRAFKNGVSTDRDKFIFSYWLVWTIVLAQRVWIITLSSFDRPIAWVESPISGVLAMSLAIAAGFGASAPLTGKIPLRKKEMIIFVVAAGFSGVIAGIAIGVFLVSGWAH